MRAAFLLSLVTLCLLSAAAFKWNVFSSFSRKPVVREIGTIVKSGKAPLLKVKDPYSQCTVHLVGVSHGAATSAELVKETMLKVKPSTVVVELCDERYLSICLESRIRPNGNASMLQVYNTKLRAYELKRSLENSSSPLSQVTL
jgi:hypothetical protein